MSKRNELHEIREIVERRSRAVKSSRSAALKGRVDRIIAAYESMLSLDSSEELFRYIPIALVACMEGYFRRAIQDLIDFQDEFRQNLKSFSDVRFGVDSVLAIHGKAVSVGEFVAHKMPISTLEHIDSHIRKLSGKAFIENVLRQESINVKEEGTNHLPESVLAQVKETFRLRHIYAHELSNEPILNQGDTFVLLIDVLEFLFASESWIYHLAGPDPDVRRRLMIEVLQSSINSAGETGSTE